MNKKCRKSVLVGGVLMSLAFLPGCALLDMFKGTEDTGAMETKKTGDDRVMTGEVLVTLKGRPIITTDSLASEKEKFLKANPQIKSALSFMDPKAFDRNLLEGLIGQYIADEYVISNKIDKTAQYRAELEDLCESMKRMLNAKYFSEKTTVSVSDKETKDFYEQNKDKLRGVVLSPGGVAAVGLEFSDNAAARAFAARAKAPQGSFKKAAQDDNLTAKIKDFKLVNAQTVGMDEMLRDKIVAIKTVPSVDVIEANGKFWVVHATAKEEAKYRPFDQQLKDALKQELEKNKRVELFQKEIDALRKEYDVTVNEDYFKVEEQPSQDDRGSEGGFGGMAAAPTKKDPEDKRLA